MFDDNSRHGIRSPRDVFRRTKTVSLVRTGERHREVHGVVGVAVRPAAEGAGEQRGHESSDGGGGARGRGGREAAHRHDPEGRGVRAGPVAAADAGPGRRAGAGPPAPAALQRERSRVEPDAQSIRRPSVLSLADRRAFLRFSASTFLASSTFLDPLVSASLLLRLLASAPFFLRLVASPSGFGQDADERGGLDRPVRPDRGGEEVVLESPAFLLLEQARAEEIRRILEEVLEVGVVSQDRAESTAGHPHGHLSLGERVSPCRSLIGEEKSEKMSKISERERKEEK